jgi:hypothetical protein
LSRSGERLAIVGLVALLILLITVPAIGEFLRGVFVALLGNTWASRFAGLANIIGVGTFSYLLIRWILAGAGSSTRLPTPSPSTPDEQPDDRVRSVIEERVHVGLLVPTKGDTPPDACFKTGHLELVNGHGILGVLSDPTVGEEPVRAFYPWGAILSIANEDDVAEVIGIR